MENFAVFVLFIIQLDAIILKKHTVIYKRGRFRRTASLALILVMLASGCIKTESFRYADLPPRSVDEIEWLSEPPSNPFEIIGRVYVEGLTLVSHEYLARTIRQEAAELGAEAVFLENVHERVSYRQATTMKPDVSRTQSGGSIGGSSFSASIDTSSTPFPPRPTRRKVALGVAIVYK